MAPSMKDFTSAEPEVYQALTAMSKAAGAVLDKPLTELVKLRASQLNGCTYCLQFHADLARKVGVSQRHLDQLAGWRDSPLFSPRERAALAWTERLTLQAQQLPGEDEREALLDRFSPEEARALAVAIATINAWNRINAALGTLPPDAAA